VAQALATTRDLQIQDRKRLWREGNRRVKVPAAETTRIVSRLVPTTLFDLLWRLRTRSDYRDAETFLFGVATPEDARSYHASMCALVNCTITVLDTLCVAYAGRDSYRKWHPGALVTVPAFAQAMRLSPSTEPPYRLPTT
jgi:hypothetical protein